MQIFLDTAQGVSTTLRALWAEATGDHASLVQAVPDMLEIVPFGTSKGIGVRMLFDHLGITPEEVCLKALSRSSLREREKYLVWEISKDLLMKK